MATFGSIAQLISQHSEQVFVQNDAMGINVPIVLTLWRSFEKEHLRLRM